jgi:hypothetical protein
MGPIFAHLPSGCAPQAHIDGVTGQQLSGCFPSPDSHAGILSVMPKSVHSVMLSIKKSEFDVLS